MAIKQTLKQRRKIKMKHSATILWAMPLILLFGACKSPEYGCTKRQQRQARKHFVKSVNRCQKEAMAQSLMFFPVKESDSTWSEVKTVFDTFTHYDTLLVNDTVYITKTVEKVVVKTNTINKETRVTDTREANILKGELKAMAAKLTKAKDAEVKAKQSDAKNKGRLSIFYWGSGILASIIGLAVGIKIFKLKIPFVG
jgi:hypothetical protein